MSRTLIVGARAALAVLLLAVPAAADDQAPLPVEEPAPAPPAPPPGDATVPADPHAPPGDATVPATDPLVPPVPEPAAPPITTTTAPGEPVDTGVDDAATDELPDQSIGAALGLAAGGRVTPGGLRVSGHYLYQLSAEDWFDGTASFTFGTGGAACFRDRMDATVCDHGLADGTGVEVTAAVRRMFAARGQFRPFVRAGVGVALVRFGDDDVTGFAVPLHAGAGLRASVGEGVAIVAMSELVLGVGRFGRDLGVEPQLGFAVTAGAELRLP